MAEPTDPVGDVLKAVEATSSLADQRKKRAEARRVEALSLYLAGMEKGAIAGRLGVETKAVDDMLNHAFTHAENKLVDQMREVEGARLDRAQVAIWPQVLQGDLRSIETFLRISTRRAKLFGLDAPTSMTLSVTVRQEMEAALRNLERLVLEGEVESDDPAAAGDRPSVESG